MDVAELIVRAGYDGAELTRGLAKSASEVARFGGEFKQLEGNVRSFRLPEPAKDTSSQIEQAVAALRQLGVEISEVEHKAGGLRTFAVLGKDVELARTSFDALGASAQIVTDEVVRQATALLQADAAMRGRIALLQQGAQLNATELQSAKELRTIYAQLSREIAQGNVPFERRIVLEKELVGIRQTFASITSRSRVGMAEDFAASVGPARQAAQSIRDVARETAGATSKFTLINKQTGEFTAAGRKASGAAIAIAFGLEAIARGGDGADAGLRTVLRSVASFAAFFGPKGLIVSGVAASTAAIIDLFTRSREEMEKTRIAFEEDITSMAREGDIAGLMKELQKLEIGQLKIDPKTGLFALSGGLKQLRAELAGLERQQQDAFQRNVTASGFTEEGKRIRELRAEIAPLEERYKSLRNIILDFPQLPNVAALAKSIRIESGGKTEDLLSKEFKNLKEQVDVAVTALGQVEGKTFLIVGLEARLLELYGKAKDMLAAQKDQLGPIATGLRGIVQDFEKLDPIKFANLRVKFPVVPTIEAPDIRNLIDDEIRRAPKNLEIPLNLKPKMDDFDLRNFEAAVRRLRDAEGLVDFAKLTGDAGFQRDAEQRLARAQTQVTNYARSVKDAMDQANVPVETQRKILAEIARITSGIDTEPTEDLADNIRAITTAARGLLDTAEGLDFISDSARDALESVLQLVDAISLLQSPGALAKLGGAIGAIGAVAGLLQSLGVIGQSPAEQERNRLLRANNEELSRLRLELSGFTGSIGERLGLARQLDVFRPAITRLGQASSVEEFQDARRALDREVLAAGLTYKELGAIAKEAGFEILNSQGRIVPEAMNQFADFLRLTAEKAVRFGEGLEAATQKLDLLNDVFDLDLDPVEQFKQQLGLLSALAPELFKEFFGSIDLGDPEQVEAALRALTQAFVENRLDLDAFGKLLSKDELAQIIRGVESGLDRLGEAARDVADDILGLPAGFRVERARFEATLTEQAQRLLEKTTRVPGTGFGGPIGATATAGPIVMGSGTTIIIQGDVNVDARERDGDELFEEVKSVAIRKSRVLGLYGTPSDAFNA